MAVIELTKCICNDDENRDDDEVVLDKEGLLVLVFGFSNSLKFGVKARSSSWTGSPSTGSACILVSDSSSEFIYTRSNMSRIIEDWQFTDRRLFKMTRAF